ncbi:amino acid adenylation domain-containing protein [Micromonospora sp. FIMYZ51]|uniref:non-ribosomal peptide synthetase n=1 Tax=Micromonospora sp. FIMYZ51 TaxID=3051832 RepID=UPI00311FD9F3
MTQQAQTMPQHARPLSPDEEVVSAVWAETLGTPVPGPEANFFALGGNSLQGARVIGRLREEFAVRIPLSLLFENQTVDSLAAAIATLRGGSVAPRSTIPRLPRQADGGLTAPASFGQRRMWVEEHLHGPSSRYNVPAAVDIEGALDVPALRAALQALVDRHEVFRTTIDVVDGVPHQLVAGQLTVALPVVDLTDVPLDQRGEVLLDRLFTSARRPFDIARGPLLRVELFRMDEHWHVLLFNLHHLITDIRSFELAVAELLRLYAAAVTGPPPQAEGPAVQYADFAAWQQQTVDEAAFGRQLDYWADVLRGPLPVLDLPTDHHEPEQPTGRAATVSIELPRALSRQLRELASASDATPFMAMLVAVNVLLHRYTGQSDIVLGMPSASRDLPELEEMLGCFLNTLAVRCDLSGDPSARELLGRVRERALGAYAHQDVPFERVVKAVMTDRSVQQGPFRVMVVSQPELPEPELPGLRISNVELDAEQAKFDLLFAVTEAESLRIALQYNTDLFAADRATRMLEHLRILLEGAVARPDTPVSELNMLSDDERRQIARWSAAECGPYRTDEFLHRMVEEQVRRTPDAEAVRCGEVRLSYRELDARADVLAAQLTAAGVAVDDFVGLCVEPSVELLVSILGTLKAGAAYVPMDPVMPTERMTFTVTDSGMKVLVTTTDLHPQLPQAAVGGLVVRYADDVDPDTGGTDRQAPESAVDAAQLVYMMYTSGTTGQPKGVVLPHSAVTPWIRWAQDVRPIGPGTRILHNLSYHFDWSVEQMFHALTSGACVVMPSRQARIDPRHTARFINDHEIHMLYLTPTQMRGLAAAGIAMPSLRDVSMGGENLDGDLVVRTRQVVSPACRIWNEYGPTETAGVALAGPMGEASVDRAAMPLGRLIANATCAVLDQWGNPQSIGIPGELWIGGDGVARGYHNRPDATADRFAPDPAEPGRRRYRTGDLVRWLANGDMEFLGRTDHQVKIRGVRVELREIESVLRAHPEVANAVVTLTPEQAVVAYLVPVPGATRDEAALRAYLAPKLPSVMHPSAIVWLDSIPTSPTGKVDRRRLPPPDAVATAAVAVEAVVAPSTEMERIVAEVWSGLLKLDVVHVHANFFEVGGDSLLLLSVVEQLRQRLRLDIPVRAVLNTPTIAGLAAQLDQLRWVLRSQEAPVPGDGPRERGEL